ncbi:phosphoesterase family-domain-containing protein [Globomyces pollinis-pini]|nr:phosphoesterase family-domain-containing protein [Globomyces pollinis-pini]
MKYKSITSIIFELLLLDSISAIIIPRQEGGSMQTILSAEQTIVSGGYIKINWRGADSNSNDDWVLFTNGDSPSKESLIEDSWQYVYGGIDQLKKGSTVDGFVSVKAPAIPGRYTVYYCQNNKYDCNSGIPVNVIPPTVTCRNPADTASSIKHVITIISENHSFDSYFGRYCLAEPGSDPKCNLGRECCEAGTISINSVTPVTLTDSENHNHDPCHSYDCMLCGINGGTMDGYLSSGNCRNSNDQNYAMANGNDDSAGKYWKLASTYAMADRFFQSAPGASSQSDMYFARGAFVFKDNDYVPSTHNHLNNKKSYYDPTIADLLIGCNVSFTTYAEGYKKNPPFSEHYPEYYDSSDIPFQYYPSLTASNQSDEYFKDIEAFQADVNNGVLPAVSYIKALGINSEHPGFSNISAGELFNEKIINQVLSSPLYRENTLILLVPDESGGYRDSIKPPPKSTVDNHPYGPRTPFLAIGHMVQKNFVSHEQMEPASIIRFIESNFLADIKPGQLHTRDAIVNNIGSLFDRNITGFDFN